MSLRREVGRQLDKMRDSAGIPGNDVRIAQICGSSRTFARLVKGERTNLTFPVIGSLCDLFSAATAKRYELERLWLVIDQSSWGQSINAYLKSGFNPYAEFEKIAIGIDNFESTYVPGLLQTERYMRRLHEANPLFSRDQKEELIEFRLARQRYFRSRDESLRLRALVPEPVLRNGCDPEQLEWLVKEDARPSVEVWYLPAGNGPHPLLGSAFSVLSFSDRIDPDLLYISAAGQVQHFEEEETVRRAKQYFEIGIQDARRIEEFESGSK